MSWFSKWRAKYKPDVSTNNSGTECAKKDKDPDTETKWVFLKNTYNTIEADIIISILDSAGILVLNKFQGIGYHLGVTGGVNNNINLYVPEAYLERAKSLINNFVGESQHKQENSDEAF